MCKSELIHKNNKERVKTTKRSQIFEISTKFTYFYSESVVYPFVNINETGKGHALDNKDLTDILHFTKEQRYVVAVTGADLRRQKSYKDNP